MSLRSNVASGNKPPPGVGAVSVLTRGSTRPPCSASSNTQAWHCCAVSHSPLSPQVPQLIPQFGSGPHVFPSQRGVQTGQSGPQRASGVPQSGGTKTRAKHSAGRQVGAPSGSRRQTPFPAHSKSCVQHPFSPIGQTSGQSPPQPSPVFEDVACEQSGVQMQFGPHKLFNAPHSGGSFEGHSTGSPHA